MIFVMFVYYLKSFFRAATFNLRPATVTQIGIRYDDTHHQSMPVPIKKCAAAFLSD